MTEIKASMAGSVWKIAVSEGETVEEDQDVVILESMKWRYQFRLNRMER